MSPICEVPSMQLFHALSGKDQSFSIGHESFYLTVSSDCQGYSSLRFRPIRHLSSPVEDLDMCKVVGVTDKVGQC